MFNRIGQWLSIGILLLFFLPIAMILVRGRGHIGDWFSGIAFLLSALFFHPRWYHFVFKGNPEDAEAIWKKSFSIGLLLFFLGLGILILTTKWQLSKTNS